MGFVLSEPGSKKEGKKEDRKISWLIDRTLLMIKPVIFCHPKNFNLKSVSLLIQLSQIVLFYFIL